MKTILELTDEMNHKVRSAKDITDRADKENRQPTDNEQATIKALLAEAKTIKNEIDSIKAAESLRAEVEAHYNGLAKPDKREVTPSQPQDSGEPTPQPTASVRVIKRTGSLKAFKGRDGDVNAYKAGQFVLASIFNNYRAARWCESNGLDVRNALSEGTNTAGGYLVPEEMTQAIIDLRESYGVFRQQARVLPMGRDTITIPRKSSRGTATFTSEGGTLTSSDFALNQVQLVAKKLGRVVTISSELDEDAVVSIGDLVADDIAYSFALKEDQCGFTGDGTSTYGGILGITQALALSGNAGSKVTAATNHDTFEEIDATDLTKLMAKLPQFAIPNAKFYCSQVAFSLVFSRLAASAGGNTIQSISGAYQPAYLGFPIVVSQVLPTATTTLSGSFMLGFGDLRLSSTMGERRGFTVARDNSIYFLQDQVAIKATERIDINNHDLGDATNAGPFVGLFGA